MPPTRRSDALATRPLAARAALTAVAALAAACVLLVCACGGRPAGTVADDDAPALRIATSGDYAPFSVWDDDASEPAGFEPELIRRWAADRGHRIEWVRFRWPQLLDDARADRFDLAVGGITVRPDRSIVGTFGVPVAYTRAVVLVRSSALGLSELDAPERRIAVNRGGHLERVARARFPNAVLLPTSPNEAVPARLASGEVDAVVTDTRESPFWRSDQPGWLQLGPLTHDDKAVFAAPERAALVADVDAWLLSQHGRRALLQLTREVLGVEPHAAHATAFAALIAAVDERLSLMPDVARFKRASGLPVEVPDRERIVLEAAWQDVRAEAARRGVEPPDEARVRAFYAAQIEAAKEIQRRVMASADTGAGHAPVPDLDGALRPALLRIGERMARLLVLLDEDAPHDLDDHQWDALATHGLPEADVAAIRSALEALAPDPPRRAPFRGLL